MDAAVPPPQGAGHAPDWETEAINMNRQATALAAGWDAAQWASGERPAAAHDVNKWGLWQWVGALRRHGALIDGRGDSGLTGAGHNPGGQHWAERRDAKS